MPANRRTARARGSRLALWVALAAVLGGTLTHAAPTSPSGASDGQPPEATAGTDSGSPTARKPLHRGEGLYPRAIRLRHNGSANGRILASTVTFDRGWGQGVISESRDGGSTFRKLATVRDSQAARGSGQCCTTLYELPRRVGDLPAGTLLWAGSPGQDAKNRRMSIRVFASTDVGRSWSYLSTVATSPSEEGLWEPEFSIDARGNLVCHYSDESEPGRSQKLMAARTSDGRNWRDHRPTVASDVPEDRPGMAVVRRLPSGRWVMTYEICAPGGQFACVVHIRTSRDGWDWGDPSDLGIRPETEDGAYFAHAPTLAWAPQRGNRHGRLLLVGQVLYREDGKRAAGSGRSVMVNDAAAKGEWRQATAPVTVRSRKVDHCPNYSSALLPSRDGTRLLEIATDYRDGTCTPYYATGPG